MIAKLNRQREQKTKTTLSLIGWVLSYQISTLLQSVLHQSVIVGEGLHCQLHKHTGVCVCVCVCVCVWCVGVCVCVVRVWCVCEYVRCVCASGVCCVLCVCVKERKRERDSLTSSVPLQSHVHTQVIIRRLGWFM